MVKETSKKISKYPILKNSPIVEALLDIQVQLPENKTLEDIHSVYENIIIKSRFPIEKKRYQFSHAFQLNVENKAPLPPTQGSSVDGFLFYSEDKLKVFQSRMDGFTLNKHRPYENWEALLGEAKELWEVYKIAAQPIAIKRIALRYINKITLKRPFIPSNYFATLPMLDKRLNYDINNLFSQISISNHSINAIANITEGIEVDNSDTARFLFDIDVIKQGDFKEREIWKSFEELRKFKNEIFFKSITETTLKLLE